LITGAWSSPRLPLMAQLRGPTDRQRTTAFSPLWNVRPATYNGGFGAFLAIRSPVNERRLRVEPCSSIAAHRTVAFGAEPTSGLRCARRKGPGCNPGIGRGLTSAFWRTNRVRPATAIGPEGGCCLGQNASDLPLFRRCFSAVFSLLSGVVLRGENCANSETWQRMVAKSQNSMSGAGWVSGDTRTHLCGGFGGFAANPLHLQQKSAPGAEKGGNGRDAPACIFPADAGAQASLFEAWKRHWCRGRRLPTAPQFARPRAAIPALAKALQKAVKCHQR
jgi:hypothetical protein